MPIEPGQRIPSLTLKLAAPDGGREVDPAHLFAGKNVVLFSVPGAFTPTCSQKHLPGYLARHDELKARGVDVLACLSVNDAWVMHAWAEAHQVGDRIAMLADGNGAFARALGIDVDYAAGHMGVRARRAMLRIVDNVVQSVDVEQPGKFEVSSAEACLLRL